jgi:hypothetical protein
MFVLCWLRLNLLKIGNKRFMLQLLKDLVNNNNKIKKKVKKMVVKNLKIILIIVYPKKS